MKADNITRFVYGTYGIVAAVLAVMWCQLIWNTNLPMLAKWFLLR